MLIVMEVCVVHCTTLKRWILWFGRILSPSAGFHLMDRKGPPKQWGALIFANNLHLQITLLVHFRTNQFNNTIRYSPENDIEIM